MCAGLIFSMCEYLALLPGRYEVHIEMAAGVGLSLGVTLVSGSV